MRLQEQERWRAINPEFSVLSVSAETDREGFNPEFSVESVSAKTDKSKTSGALCLGRVYQSKSSGFEQDR